MVNINETSALLSHFEGNPPVNSGFPWQGAINLIMHNTFPCHNIWQISSNSSVPNACEYTMNDIHGLAQYCSNSIANALELLQSYAKPKICYSLDLLHLHAGRGVQKDCHWGLKNGGNSHWSREPIMQWGSFQSQYISRPTDYKSAMPAN